MSEQAPRPTGSCGDNGGRTRSGFPCRQTMNLSPTTGLCIWHDLTRGDERKALHAAAVAASARASHLRRIERQVTTPDNMPRFEPDTLERLAKWHQWASRAVGVGEVDARTGDSICRHLKELRPTLIQLGLEKRVRELEAELRRYKKRVGER